jgi:hypothetical protein
MEVLLKVLPIVIVGAALYFIARFLRTHDMIRVILKEIREAASLQPTCEAINFFGFSAVFIFMVLCFAIKEVHYILEMALSTENSSESSLYEAGLIAFCALALGMVLLFSMKICKSVQGSDD